MAIQPSGQFIPILLPGSKPEHIPDAVRGHNHYVLATFDLSDPQYEALYRHLTDQPATRQPDLGQIQILPPKPRPQVSPGPLPPRPRPDPSGNPLEKGAEEEDSNGLLVRGVHTPISSATCERES